jgi:putative ABC transport system substrate-binding protein
VIERRALVIALGVLTSGPPLTAPAQPATKPARVGWLAGSSPQLGGFLVEVFTQQMRQLGYNEGKDVVYDIHWAAGNAERFPELAREIVAQRPDVIFVTGGIAAVLAAQQATRSIPIVAISLPDPVAMGLARSLAQPGGNVTGLSDLAYDSSPKRIEFLRAIVPNLNRVGVLWPSSDPQPLLLKSLLAAAQAVGVDVVAMGVASPAELQSAFEQMARQHVGGVFPLGSVLAFAQRNEVADLALKHRIAAVFPVRDGALAGGLMSYGPDNEDVFRHAATYVDKILKGAKPSELPIEQATKIKLVINLKTAKALGLTIPQSLLLRADEVIQ